MTLASIHNPRSHLLLANPKILQTSTINVQGLLSALPRTNPTKFTISGTLQVPPWYDGWSVNSIEWHIQGIAPYNGNGGPTIANGCFSASSSSGYFAGFSQAYGQQPMVRSVVPNSFYYHAAGIQMLGDLLAVPLESNQGTNACVQFFNVGNLSSPQYLYTLDMPATKASAVGITTYTDSEGEEWAMLVVYEYDHRYMYVYRALASQVATNQWTLVKTYTGSALQGDQFQCFSLVTQVNTDGSNSVYLCGFREDEELHLYLVNTANAYGDLTAVTTLTGWNGSDWRNGVGLQIASSSVLRIFGTDKDPSGTVTDYTLGIYVWENA